MNLNKILSLLFIGTIVSFAMPQEISRSSTKALPGELLVAQVNQRVGEVMMKLGRNPGRPAKHWMQLRTFAGGTRQWLIFTENRAHQLILDAREGFVIGYFFQARRDDQLRQKGRTGVQFFKSASQAKHHLRKFAELLGIPRASVLSDFTWKRDGEVKDANSAGSVGAVFKDSRGKVLGTVSCDPQDGALVVFTRAR